MSQVDVKDDPRLLPSEVAKQLRVALTTINKWINHGVGGVKLRADRVGGLWRIRQSAVDEFISASSQTPTTGDASPQSGADKALDRIGI